jgi:hypothetical protein
MQELIFSVIEVEQLAAHNRVTLKKRPAIKKRANKERRVMIAIKHVQRW